MAVHLVQVFCEVFNPAFRRRVTPCRFAISVSDWGVRVWAYLSAL
jgi:hypothetical protein